MGSTVIDGASSQVWSLNGDAHTHTEDGQALVDVSQGWSEKESHLRNMSFQPDEQSASSKDLYPNQ